MSAFAAYLNSMSAVATVNSVEENPLTITLELLLPEEPSLAVAKSLALEFPSEGIWSSFSEQELKIIPAENAIIAAFTKF